MHRFVGADKGGNIYLFQLRTNRFSRIHQARQCVTSLVFNNNPEMHLLVGLADGAIRVLTLDGKVLDRLRHHRAAVHCLAPYPTGEFLVSCAHDSSSLWSISSTPRRRLRAVHPDGPVLQACFLPDGHTLVALTKRDGVTLHCFPSLELRARLLLVAPSGRPLAPACLSTFALTADGEYLLATDGSTKAQVRPHL